MTIPLFHVDAFTDRPFAGNPAAVCILPSERPDAWLQQVGAEMNLSETAFVQKHDDGFRLRWFTPKVEVDLCGHATLASAHVLWEEGHARPDEIIRFHTRSGLLTASRNAGFIELDFPLIPEEPATPPPGLVEALGVQPRYVGKGRFDYLLEVDSEETLRKLAPNFRQLASLPVRGMIVTSRSSRPEFDFVSRFFAPCAGIDEDPVTGSAHCCLAGYWQKHLHKNSFVAYQASARGGVVRVRVSSDRAILGGQAVTVAKGTLAAGRKVDLGAWGFQLAVLGVPPKRGSAVKETTLTIRDACVDDLPVILRFIHKKAEFDGVPQAVQATIETLRQTLFADPPLAHVAFAEVGGKPVGFASYFFTFSTFLARPGIWLDDLYVDADQRSQGVGRGLLLFLARLARSKGCGRIEWTAATSNERGLVFYRRHGATVREGNRLCRLDAAAIDRLAQESTE